jgi:surface antigen
MSRFVRRFAHAVLVAAVTGGLATGLATIAAAPAHAAVSVRVESQITAHYLPYLNSPYVSGSTLTAGQSAPVECKAQGREAIGGSSLWYRINTRYYPAYAFAPASITVLCGQSKSVPLAANGYTAPSFSSTPREGWFSSNDSIMVLCTAIGSSHAGSNAWFFARGYWLHSTRIAGGPTGRGFSTCPGYRHPISDDYTQGTSGVDPWGFYAGQCTSFVAWRLNDRNQIAFHNYYRGYHFGNANSWDEAARSAGIPVNGTPRVGAVAQSDGGSFGHVAWVAALNTDGTVLIEEYNWSGGESYGQRTVSRSSFEYIHFPTVG